MKRVTFQVTDDLYEEIEESAGEQSVSEWLRDAARMKIRQEGSVHARAPVQEVDEESLAERVAEKIAETAEDARKP